MLEPASVATQLADTRFTVAQVHSPEVVAGRLMPTCAPISVSPQPNCRPDLSSLILGEPQHGRAAQRIQLVLAAASLRHLPLSDYLHDFTKLKFIQDMVTSIAVLG